MTHFTQEQLKELETIYGLKRVLPEGTLPVRDGVVTKETKVWWRGQTGPDHVVARYHWENICEFPKVYQLAEPKRKLVYVD